MFFNVPTVGTETTWDMVPMARFMGETFVVQVRAYNSAGYSPWTPPQEFTTPGSSTSTTVGSSTTSTTAA